MKRKLKWIAVVLAVLLLGMGVALLLWARDRITSDSWKQIRLGMTMEEVERILGGPGIITDELQAHIGKEPFVSTTALVEQRGSPLA